MGKGCQYHIPGALLGTQDMPTQLPDALLRSDDYLDLNEKQVFNLQSRFDYIDEVVDDITQWLNGEGDSETLDDFLNLLEVDVAVNQNLNIGNDYESNWVIHSSWHCCPINWR